MNVGEKIRAARKELKMTQAEWLVKTYPNP